MGRRCRRWRPAWRERPPPARDGVPVTAAALLAYLERLGVRVAIDGARLRLDAPAGTLTPDLLATLAAHKPALLGLLATPADTASGQPRNEATFLPVAIRWARERG